MTNARTELNERLKRVAKARSVEEAATKAHDRARANIERADSLLKARQAELADLDAQEAAAKIGADGLPMPPTAAQRQARRTAEDDLAIAQRAVRTVTAHAAVYGEELGKARAALAEAERDAEQFVTPVIEEEGRLLLAHWQEQRAKTIDAEKAVRSLLQAMTTRQFFAPAERLTNQFRDGSQRVEYQTDAAPFLAMFDRLKQDAHARVL